MSEQQLRLSLLKSSKKIYDESHHELSVHYRVNKMNNMLEIVINRSCNNCLNFKKISKDTEICVRCSYVKDWLGLGKQ